MTRVSRFSLVFLAALAITPVACYAGPLSAAGGHGSYVWARILFPYVLALQGLLMPRHALPEFLFIGLAIAQFPAYGLLLGIEAARNRFLRGLTLLLGIHAGLTLRLYSILAETWTK